MKQILLRLVDKCGHLSHRFFEKRVETNIFVDFREARFASITEKHVFVPTDFPLCLTSHAG